MMYCHCYFGDVGVWEVADIQQWDVAEESGAWSNSFTARYPM